MSLVTEAAAIRAKLVAKQRAQEAKEEEEGRERQLQADLRRLRAAKLQQEEDEAKTRRFYEVNAFQRRIQAKGSPYYFGELETRSTAWLPHGRGQFFVNGEVVLDGLYKKGCFVGGEMRWTGGEVWKGRVQGNCMQGAGTLTRDGQTAHIVAHDNAIVCCLEDLRPGIQLSVQFGTDRCARTMVTITRHAREWVFLCRFHDEVQPRDRHVDLAVVPGFEVLWDFPAVLSIYEQEQGEGKVAAPSAGVDHSWRSARCTASKHTRCALPASLDRDRRRRNFFESKAVGIGIGRSIVTPMKLSLASSTGTVSTS